MRLEAEKNGCVIYGTDGAKVTGPVSSGIYYLIGKSGRTKSAKKVLLIN
ncbi:MAG: hypothetical protein PHW02_01745 [bacterium]|nr:hypothetical protein [bacterium]